jgi:hypothetical protein
MVLPARRRIGRRTRDNGQYRARRVVGIHCGDTASLPGLNLPTTSIRLALWVDALTDLGLERSIIPTPQKPPFTHSLALGALTAIIVFSLATASLAAIYFKQQRQIMSKIVAPVSIALIAVSNDDNRAGAINVTTAAPSHLYVLFNKSADETFLVYPTKDAIAKDELANGLTTITLTDDLKSSWQASSRNLLVVNVRRNLRLLRVMWRGT